MRTEVKKTDKGWVAILFGEDDQVIKHTKVCKDRRQALREARK